MKRFILIVIIPFLSFGQCVDGDFDNDGICDEVDDCIGTWITDLTTGNCNEFTSQGADVCSSYSGCEWTSFWNSITYSNSNDCLGSYELDNSYCDELELLISGCMDESACNYDEFATYDDGSCEYPNVGYDCNGNCIEDEDSDDICDDLDDCIGTWIEDITTGSCSSITNQSTCINYGCTWSQAVYTGIWQWEDLCGYEGNSTYIIDNSYCDELDDCDGEYDECGICNGSGPEEFYDCAGNCLNDTDGDGICDEVECFTVLCEEWYECILGECICLNDIDFDEICDEYDNCIDVFNPDQIDTNNDGIGDECDYSSIDDYLINRKIIQITDLLGRSIKNSLPNQVLLYHYNDGTVIKSFQF